MVTPPDLPPEGSGVPAVHDIAEAEVAIATATPSPHDARVDTRLWFRRPILERPTVRLGILSWSLVGIVLVLTGLFLTVREVAVVVVPVVLALFPAAVLYPATERLRRLGMPSSVAALIVLFGTIGIVVGIVNLLAPSVAAQLEDLGAAVADGYEQLESFLAGGPFGLDPINLDQLIERGQDMLTSGEGELGTQALEVAVLVFEGFTGTILLLFVLFFMLKDGPKMARWARDVFPERLRPDAEVVGGIVWTSVGGYIRGQLIVAFIDAVGIGIGLAILRVPLALPLAVLVFFGGLFPIVGAAVSGSVAVLVALATGGPTKALLVVALVIGVQQLESHLLLPLILGRTVSLHPLAVILALAIGGILLGILGAFLAVPIAAAISRAVGYLRHRTPG